MEVAAAATKLHEVGGGANEVWGGMGTIRNALAHEREEGINRVKFRAASPSTLERIEAQMGRLVAADWCGGRVV